MKNKTLQLSLIFTAILLLVFIMIPAAGIYAQGDGAPTPPAATRIPPTLVPAPPATSTPEAIAMSGISQIQETNTITVGTLYNSPPFSWLDEQGDVVGYEPEVLRAVAVDLGVDIEFVQVTSETAEQMLSTGEIDMLIGQRIHSKDAEAIMDFSHTYFYNRQLLVVRQDAIQTSLADFANQRVSVVAGSPAEESLNQWISANGVPIQIDRQLSQSDALDALQNGSVAAMAGEYDDLRRAGRQGMRFINPINEVLRLEPYAIAFRRYDINLRNAVNLALQHLTASGRMDEIAQNWFDEEEIGLGANFAALIPVYQDFNADVRKVTDFPPDMPVPLNNILAKIQQGEQLVVAGVSLNEGEPFHVRFLDQLSRELMFEMGRRWGVNIVFLPDTVNQGQDQLVQGNADIAIGVEPRWEGVDRVEYSVPFHYRSDKMIVLDGSRFRYFNDLRGGHWIAYFDDDPADFDRLEELKDFFNTSPDLDGFSNMDTLYDLLVESRDMDALFGNSIRLQAFMAEHNPELWRFIANPRGGDFSDGFEPIVIAVPRGESDFLSLVNWTLGEMVADGTFARIWEEHYPGFEAPPFIPNFPGSGDFLYQQIR
ncbi:MAG: transporter substrate-binding domain-containing protein [Chloroflexi bacterium]|nr:transporter substrate-binding domain-containing protein [Chloroflexota bacterium]